MANEDKAYGLRAVRHASGGVVQTNEYKIASGYAANIFSGDPVKLVAAGVIEIAAGGATNAIGVFAGCSYVDETGRQVFSNRWPTGITATEIKATVYDDPNIIYAIQSDATGVAAADIGAMADWEIVAGDVAIGVSKTNLDTSLAVGAAKAGLRIRKIVEIADNEVGAFASVEVMFAENAYNTVGAGI